MFRLLALGSISLQADDDGDVRPVLTQPKRLGLLAYLAAAGSPGDFHRRDTLLGVFWPELDEDRARQALSQALYYLRQALGPEVLVNRGKDEVAVDPKRLWCDAAAFQEARETGGPAALQRAVELYRGDFLPGFFIPGAEGFESWLEEARADLRRSAVDAAWALADMAEAEGRLPEAGQWGRRGMQLAVYDDAGLRRLIELLDRAGDRIGAIRVYEEAAERLARSYALEPTPETRRLIEEVRARTEVRVGDAEPRHHDLDRAETAASRPASVEGRPPGREVDSRDGRRAEPAGRVPSLRRRWLNGRVAVLGAGVASILLVWLARSSFLPDDVGGVADVRRVAVLPLADYSTGGEAVYLADGLTAELISRLSRLRDLRVIARTSVMGYRGSDKSIAQIGQELGVGTVVEGSVRMVRDSVRVTVRIIDVATEEPLWSQDYDARLADMLGIQRDIAENIALALNLETRSDFGTGAAQRATSDEAYADYLAGRRLMDRLDQASLFNARDHFQRAVDHDSTFALAWSGLAEIHIRLATNGLQTGRESGSLAREAAERALRLDDETAEAHASLATVQAMHYWDAPAAEAHFERALELDPSYADAHRAYATHLRNLGRFDEALRAVRQAQNLDPLSPLPVLEEGIIHYMAGRLDRAIAQAERVLSSNPEGHRAHFLLALAYKQDGRYPDALVALDRTDPEWRRAGAVALRGYINATVGREEEARSALEHLEGGWSAPVSSFHKSIIHVALGEHERAIDLLELAARERTWLVRLLHVEPNLDPLRGHPRFQALLRRVGLAEDAR